MKKNIFFAFFAAVLLCLSMVASAVPAKKGNISVRQPDGTTITIRVHGDEWFHYVTDENGNILEENESGFLVKSTATLETIRGKMAMAQTAKRQALQMRQEAIAKAQAKGSPKIPVILVQFSDKSFSISNPKAAFEKLLMEPGYSENGGTGSVADYYYDQSRGAYTPEFVVMDVVTLSGKLSTYGTNDNYAAKALYEACQKLDSTVDFSQFDNDGDGKIDMTLMYFAGYNEAEGGPSSTIWPHQFYVPYVVTNAQSFDGVKLDRYFCTSELKGSSGTRMCGIGTTCHEFAHSLGLPDFYDTNYNEYGDGEAGATYEYDVMCSGSYNNNGCTPPWMNAEELVMLGWMDSITELSTVGPVSIPSISSGSPIAYKTPTSVSGEYFLFECRPGTKWDSPLAAGLLVYHVDKSTSHTVTWKDDSGSHSSSAYYLWARWESTNAINASGSHPCFYIVPSGNLTSLNYSGSRFTFPGSSNVTTYTPVEWSGEDTGFTLSGISFNSSTETVSFNLTNSNECGVNGLVLDSEGNPIQGATVTVKAQASSSVSANSGVLRRASILKASGASLASATTDANGAYSISIENPGSYVVEASKEGYVSKTAALDISRMTTQNFYLLREGETVPSEIYTYPDNPQWYVLGFGDNPTTIMAANEISSSMLNPYAGKQIKSISFLLNGEATSEGVTTTKGTVHALIDYGSERKAFVEVANPSVTSWNTVDLTDKELIIPEGKDIYAGYALKDWEYDYCLVATKAVDDTKIGYYSGYDTTSAKWYALTDGESNYVYAIKLTIGDYTKPETGYNFIDNPKDGIYSVGDTFELNLIETASDLRPNASGIEWFFDDEPVSGPVRLSASGVHTVTAKFTTVSGEKKVIDLEITVR